MERTPSAPTAYVHVALTERFEALEPLVTAMGLPVRHGLPWLSVEFGLPRPEPLLYLGLPQPVGMTIADQRDALVAFWAEFIEDDRPDLVISPNGGLPPFFLVNYIHTDLASALDALPAVAKRHGNRFFTWTGSRWHYSRPMSMGGPGSLWWQDQTEVPPTTGTRLPIRPAPRNDADGASATT